MTRFDFLRDAPPDLVGRLRRARLPRHLHGIAAALSLLLCVLLGARGIEAIRIRDAATVERVARARFDASRAALDRMRWARARLDAILAQDRRLRRIRLSGALIAERLVRMGNRLPQGVWLASVQWEPGRRMLQGRAQSVTALNQALANLIADRSIGEPESVRMSREGSLASGVLTFEMRLRTAP